ncbi:hypothetical protein CHS0354_038036 [Potamilus streckersoni]|uniref:Uncharacterized protein n=1 Tax=Potamilus streckersoni TaxID=2493646 RepID=A0AAE0W0K3_9BIVA|nr:hypothetical protein CHS0354_038036 [Potamilus streckersoni]
MKATCEYEALRCGYLLAQDQPFYRERQTCAKIANLKAMEPETKAKYQRAGTDSYHDEVGMHPLPFLKGLDERWHRHFRDAKKVFDVEFSANIFWLLFILIPRTHFVLGTSRTFVGASTRRTPDPGKPDGPFLLTTGTIYRRRTQLRPEADDEYYENSIRENGVDFTRFAK